jgi:bile acid:Na+ symporter, BASS family
LHGLVLSRFDQMSYLIQTALFMLMVSVGMSLELTELASTLRRLNLLTWLRMVLATFILPPLFALILANLFRLTMGELAGIFMVGAMPGAPLLTRNLARKGFDMHLAASYQVWSAMLVPVMIPGVVALAAKLYSRDIWISPAALMTQIAYKQLLPLALGMVIAWAAPKLSQRYQPTLNALGNIIFTIIIGLVLFKLGPALKAVTPMLPIVALLLALGSIGAVWLIRLTDPIVKETFAICNVNRHVGLAMMLSGQYLHATNSLSAIACYALIAPMVMFGYARWYRGGRGNQKSPISNALPR